MTVAIAIFTSKSFVVGPQMVDDHGWPSLRTIAIATPIFVLVQVALGAGFRHGLERAGEVHLQAVSDRS